MDIYSNMLPSLAARQALSLSEWPAGSGLTPDDQLVDLAPDTLVKWKQVSLAN